MKLVTYERAGEVRHGRLDGETIVDLGTGDLQRLIEAGGLSAGADGRAERAADLPGGDGGRAERAGGLPGRDSGDGGRAERIDSLPGGDGGRPERVSDLPAGAGGRHVERAGASPAGDGDRVELRDVRLRAPLLRPGKLLAAAANYQDHVTESGGEPLDKSRLSPRLFLKPPTSIAGSGDKVELPDLTSEMDWEAELGVVIGRRCRNVPVEGALTTVFGYLAANDVSARSLDVGYERDTDDRAVWFFDWLAGKWFDGFAPMGPWLVTADEVPDPQALEIRFELNGETRQLASSKDMIFSVAELIAWASRLTTLEPGDVLLTGTPAGVGAATGRFLRPGDEMRVTVEKLGTLVNHVA